MTNKSRGASVGVLLLVALVVAAGPVVGAESGGNATDASVTLDSCTTVTDPGHYVLVSDIRRDEADEPCLVINSDGVTLDGRNHSVAQRDASTVTVRITGVNVTVRDLSVTGGVEYNTGYGSTSRVSVSGGELFVDARRTVSGDGTVVEKTVRVSEGSDGSSSSSSSSSVSSSVSVGNNVSSSLGRKVSSFSTPNAPSSDLDELSFDGETLPSICGFGRTDAYEE